MARSYSFKKTATRKMLSEWKELKSAPGYKYRARTYSVDGNAAVKEATMDATDLPDEVIIEMAEIMEKQGLKDELQIKDIMKSMSPVNRAKIVQSRSHSAVLDAKALRLVLLHGIGEHNFFEDEETSKVVDEDLVENIIDFKDMALEMAQGIQEWNSPLLKKRDSKSGTPPNGSTTEQTSDPEKDFKTKTGTS